MYSKHLRLGYQGPNRTIRETGVLTDRTARLATVTEKGIDYLVELYRLNLRDLLTILQWNVEHGILFYRASSSLAPHITNPRLLREQVSGKDKKDRAGEMANVDYRRLVYELDCVELRRVRKYIEENGIRLTFHPETYLVLNAEDEGTLENSYRDLYYHYRIMKLLGLGPDSIIVLHGGGVYGDKLESGRRWALNYMRLPRAMQERIVLENDEKNYSIEDVLVMSSDVVLLQRARGLSERPVPVVFDIFHYQCHNIYRERRGLPELPEPSSYMRRVIDSWPATGRVKMHLSEQRPDAPLGSHSDYIERMPELFTAFWKRYRRDLDVMIEAKMGEKAVFYLLGLLGSEHRGVKGGGEDIEI
jgi:UV DNA damage endonuclease